MRISQRLKALISVQEALAAFRGSRAVHCKAQEGSASHLQGDRVLRWGKEACTDDQLAHGQVQRLHAQAAYVAVIYRISERSHQAKSCAVSNLTAECECCSLMHA